MKNIAFATCLALLLGACGGGGGNPGICAGSAQYCAAATPAPTPSAAIAISSNETTGPLTYIAANVAQQCASPRPAGTVDPLTGQLYGDRVGSLGTENAWIRAFVNETYLWYGEVPSTEPAPYVLGAVVPYVEPASNFRVSMLLASNTDVVEAYFNSQRTLALSASGKPKDRFHFTYPTAEWTALAGSGSSVGFGFEVSLVATSPPRKAVIAFSQPGSIAALNGLNRGTQFISINGANVATGDVSVLNEGLFSPQPGKPYTFQVLDLGSSVTRTVVVTPGTVISVPVQNVRTLAAPNAAVGYMQFNDHIATAESPLIAGINLLKGSNGGAGISDLILDLRYNGGGYLDLAGELAFMIAGPTATAGKAFEKLSYNDKNPFGLSEADKITPFHQVTQGFSTIAGQSLPYLGLSRVYVITGGDTCSASESVMNGLRGAGIEVIQIGGTTCGKPYGFYPEDNCGTTYFAVQFKGVNQLGFGDYPDGFIPGGSGGQSYNLPGCVVADDFTKLLGDSSEARIAAALQHRSTGSCGTAPLGSSTQSVIAANLIGAPVLGGRSLARESRLYRPKPRF